MDKQKKAFNGRVTKFMDDGFGFVDSDVFFRIEAVEGPPVKVGDEVYVECIYDENLPHFKWNATKIKLINNNLQQQQRVATTYLQHRMQMLQQQTSAQQQQQLVQHQQLAQQLTNKNVLNADQGNYFTPEIRKLIEKQQQQQQQPNAQMPNYQPNIQNNQPQFNNRQNDFQNQPFNAGQQITYTSTPGSAFVSPVLPFNQTINVQQQQQPLPIGNIRQFANQQNNFQKRDHNRNRNLDNKDRDDYHKRDHNRDRNRNLDRSLDRKDDQRHNRDDRAHDKARDDRLRDHRDNRDKDRKNQARTRNTESPSNSVTSSSNTNSNIKPRRRYTPLNVPSYEILKSPINTYDIKRKFDSTIHVPSDFKELQINEKFELNFQSLHKPIQYRIVHDDKKEDNDKKDEKSEVSKTDSKKESTSKDAATEEKVDENNDKSKDKSNDKSNDKSSIKDEKEESKDDKSKKKSLVISHKYAVKVLLLSFPSMNNIYDRVIENDKDNNTSSKAYFLHFNKVFSYLCLRKENDGHALIGGKFDPKLDGYLSEDKPNLIQTAIRCVKQQTGIDLSSCKKWKHVCTFIYNRDDSLFYDNVSFEYSKIFIPDIWSLLEKDPSASNLSIKNEEPNASSLDDSKDNFTNGNESSFNSLQVNASSVLDDLSSINNSKLETVDTTTCQVNETADVSNLETDPSTISQLNELKVTELRSRLEELGHKPAKSLKKADLIVKLADILRSNLQKVHEQQNEGVKPDEDQSQDKTVENENGQQPDESISNVKEENESQDKMETSDNQLNNTVVNEEVRTETQENSSETESNKRKIDEDASDEVSAKKIKQESEEPDSNEPDNKELEAISKDGFIMAYGSSSITVLNLYQALNHNKYDHFELQIVSELLKEALICHFSNYILSTCYENRHLLKELQDDKKEDSLKDTLENNYVLLAFSYFDSCHCGYVIADDLQKALSCCGVNFSKRTWTYIFGPNEKIRYRLFKEPTKIYNFKQIKESKISNQSSKEVKGTLYEKDGNVYDIDKLIEQSENDEKLKVELQVLQDTIKNLQSNLNEQEAKQKKMNIAFKKQNDEICDYKRDKEKIKSKYEEAFKLISSSLNSFTDFVKKHEDRPDKNDKGDKNDKADKSKDRDNQVDH